MRARSYRRSNPDPTPWRTKRPCVWRPESPTACQPNSGNSNPGNPRGTKRIDNFPEKTIRRGFTPALGRHIHRRNLQVNLFVFGELEKIGCPAVWRPILEWCASQMVEYDRDLRKAIHDLAEQRQTFLLHLHANRNVLRRGALPEWIGLGIDEPRGLIWQCRPGGEEAHSGAATGEPIVECLRRIRCHRVYRTDRGKTRRNSRDRVHHIAVVVTVGRGGMYDCRLIDAGAVHRGKQHVIRGRPLARPGRLRPTKRRQWIVLGIRRDDMRMNVNDRHDLHSRSGFLGISRLDIDKHLVERWA